MSKGIGILFVILSLILGVLPGCASYDKCRSGSCLDDAKISENLQVRLDNMPDVGPPGTLHVKTKDGVVYLTGVVSAGLEKHLAESVAMQSSGVVRVVNSIDVDRGP